jgi:hypothetical protein
MIEPSTGFLNLQTKGLDRLQVRPGSFLSFRVNKQLSEHTWLIHLQGQDLKVSSTIPLETGKLFRALVILREGVLTLKVQEPFTAAQSVIDRYSFPDTTETRLIIQSFMEQGIALKEEIITRAVQFFRSFRPLNRKNGRLLALLYDKGIYPGKEEFSRFLEVLGEPGENNDRDSRQPRYREGNRNQGNDADGYKEKSSSRQGNTQKELVKSIKDQMERRDNGRSLLQLFNHLKARENNWTVFPLYFDPERGIEKAVARLHIDRLGRTDSFSLSFYGKQEYHFRGTLKGKERRIELYMDGDGGASGPGGNIEELRKKLHNLSFEIDDTIKGTERFSAFGGEDLHDLREIDTIL